MFGSRKNSKREKCLKMPQNPTRQVHALLGNRFIIRLAISYMALTQLHAMSTDFSMETGSV
jgi:hypothetical protein